MGIYQVGGHHGLINISNPSGFPHLASLPHNKCYTGEIVLCYNYNSYLATAKRLISLRYNYRLVDISPSHHGTKKVIINSLLCCLSSTHGLFIFCAFLYNILSLIKFYGTSVFYHQLIEKYKLHFRKNIILFYH